MITMHLPRLFAAAAFALALAAPSVAATDFIDTFQIDLYGGRLADAEAAATARLAVTPDDGQARFALGAAQFLTAVEHLVQGLHHYGLRSTYDGFGLGILPILRLPIPDNPDPAPITYEAFRGLLSRFADDLGVADSTLAGVTGEADLPLDLTRLKLDFVGDGEAAHKEALASMLAVVIGVPFSSDEAAGMPVAFDASDVLWLRAYCNLLIAIADFPLGYDFREAYRTTFAGIFPKGADFLSTKVQDEAAAMARRLSELGVGPDEYIPYPGGSSRDDSWKETPEGKRYLEAESLQRALDYAGIADLVAFIHLMHWPVADAPRLKDVLTHLEAMSALSRQSWKSILAETDDGGVPSQPAQPGAEQGTTAVPPSPTGGEWIPNPRQHGALPRMRITPEIVDGWMQFLDQFDGILAGRILLPHWRYRQGFNLNKMLTEPGPFDPVLMIQGTGIEPYLEDGQIADPAVWSRIMEIFGGNFMRYFIWIN